jgi:hypothetical protein
MRARKTWSVPVFLLLAACATPTQQTSGVEPSFNFDVAQSMASIDAMKAYAQKTGAQLWINHDREQNARIPKAPAFVQ